MKKNYEESRIEIQLFSQDIITSSVFVEWDNDWKGDGNQNGDGWIGNIFG